MILKKKESFLRKCQGIDLKFLELEPYPKSYCQHILNHLEYYTEMYERVFNMVIEEAGKPAHDLSILDYGAGNGFLGMFAKFYGFKEVWLCDISGVFLEAARKTAESIGIKLDGYILGDIEAVKEFFIIEQLCPDITLSTDVIEHIYDIDNLFAGLKYINPNLISVFTTASNPDNFMKVKWLHRMQLKDELIGDLEVEPTELKAKGLTGLSYLDQRKQIIKGSFPNLSLNLVSELAKNTRGKSKYDIIKAVEQYIKTGEMPIPPADPYWVCDPETGSWTERILPIKVYKDFYSKYDFFLRVSNGIYNEYDGNKFRRGILKIMNYLMLNRRVGSYFAPYIVLLGTPNYSE